MNCIQYIFSHPDVIILKDSLSPTTVYWINNTFFIPDHVYSVYNYVHSLSELQAFKLDLIRYNISLQPDQFETLLRLRGATYNLLYLNDSYQFMTYNEYHSRGL